MGGLFCWGGLRCGGFGPERTLISKGGSLQLLCVLALASTMKCFLTRARMPDLEHTENYQRSS